MKGLLLTCVLILSCAAKGAEVYVWTDEDGNQHFSDLPPASQEDDVKKESFELENIDEGYPYTDPDLYRDRAGGYLERKQKKDREAQELAARRAAAMQKICAEARQRLAAIRGPVNFLDDDGNVVPTTEAERQAEEDDLRRQIDKHCN